MKRKSDRARERRRASRSPVPAPSASSALRGSWLTLGTLLASAALQSAMPSPLFASVHDRHFRVLARPPLPEFGGHAAQNVPSLQQPPTYTFAISPGPLEDVLADVGRVTGAQFSFGLDQLRSIQSPGDHNLLRRWAEA